jgi:hypothetical protein
MEPPTRTVNQRAVRSMRRLAGWTLVWVASLALARFGPSLLWDFQPVVGWIAIVVNLAVGAGWVLDHARFLRDLDDLQRKIMLEAMAAALGVGLVGGFAFAAANAVGLVAFDVDIAFFSALLGVVYALASVIGTLRYR